MDRFEGYDRLMGLNIFYIYEQLEAQVVDIKDDMVCVHYNGWERRWDEWINLESPRIALFRTYTVG